MLRSDLSARAQAGGPRTDSSVWVARNVTKRVAELSEIPSHADIIAAIKRKDARAAQKIMSLHLKEIKPRIFGIVQQNYGLRNRNEDDSRKDARLPGRGQAKTPSDGPRSVIPSECEGSEKDDFSLCSKQGFLPEPALSMAEGVEMTPSFTLRLGVPSTRLRTCLAR